MFASSNVTCLERFKKILHSGNKRQCLSKNYLEQNLPDVKNITAKIKNTTDGLKN